jgi:hypothetical protein
MAAKSTPPSVNDMDNVRAHASNVQGQTTIDAIDMKSANEAKTDQTSTMSSSSQGK